MTHNEGEYSKLAMGPLWSEILDNIRAIINPDDRQPPPNRLALFSGHDTTILPLLVTLGPDVWDGQWPPYASMMIIEVSSFDVSLMFIAECTKPTLLTTLPLFLYSFVVDSRNYRWQDGSHHIQE